MKSREDLHTAVRRHSKELQSIMTEQGNIAPHGNSYEKVLGMKYMLEFDSLQVGEFQLDASANTKRAVLSQISKVFDPLGLYLPVSNEGKIFDARVMGC